MHATKDLSALQLAAAEALGAGRAAAGCSGLPPRTRSAAAADPGLDVLAGRSREASPCRRSSPPTSRRLLAVCDVLVAEGTEMRTEWMPKSVCGDDVTEWEPWTRRERTPEAEGLVVVAEALRRFLARRDHVADLVSAEAALAVLRERPGRQQGRAADRRA